MQLHKILIVSLIFLIYLSAVNALLVDGNNFPGANAPQNVPLQQNQQAKNKNVQLQKNLKFAALQKAVRARMAQLRARMTSASQSSQLIVKQVAKSKSTTRNSLAKSSPSHSASTPSNGGKAVKGNGK